MDKESYFALLTPEQMGQADQITIASGVSEIDLMAAAGRAVADHIFRNYQRCTVGVLCGPGNNGGDGFVIARALQDAGWPVRLSFEGDADKLGAAARYHFDRWLPGNEVVPSVIGACDLYVDAMFGAGLSRPISGSYAEQIKNLNAAGKPIIAVDVPSGVDGTTGEVRGVAVNAHATVTFFRFKPGHILLPGKTQCGNLELRQIGIEPNVLAQLEVNTWQNDPTLWKVPAYLSAGHKFSRGHCLVLSGPPLSTGASRLSAMAALRTGAGLVSLYGGQEALAEHSHHLTEIMLRADVLTQLLDDKRFNAIILGPGAGVSDDLKAQVLTAIKAKRSLVLDADALTVFESDPKTLFDHIHQYGGDKIVLTPHGGEFARLFAEIDDSAGKLAQTRRAANQSGATVVLKGADSVIAAPDGRAVINSNAPAWLATAGAGDVLAGIIGGLLARGMSGFEAASAGVFIHGACGNEFGQEGMIASDLVAELPKVLSALGK